MLVPVLFCVKFQKVKRERGYYKMIPPKAHMIMQAKGQRRTEETVLKIVERKMSSEKGSEKKAFVHEEEVQEDILAKDQNIGSQVAPSEIKSKTQKYSLGRLFVKRFHCCSKIIFPKIACRSTLLFALLLLASLLQQYIIYNVGLIPSRFFKVLGAKDSKAFKPLIFQALYFIVGIALANSVVKYIAGILYVQWRDLLTSRLHQRYFCQETFYHINTSIENIDNADQRITQDVDKFSNQLSEISPKLLISPLTIAYYSYQCFTNTGYFGPLSIYLYFVVGSIINRIIMSPIVGLVVKQERNEGDFRFKHVNIRTNSESVAFLQGSQIEKKKSDATLQQLLGIQQTIVNYEFWLNLSVNLFDYLGSILSYFVIAIPIFAGLYDDKTSVQLSALISQNAFVSMYLISCFSTLMDLSGKVTDIAGYTHRIGELYEALKKYNKECKQNNENFVKTVEERELSEGQTVFFDLKDLSYSALGSRKCLVEELNLTVMTQKSILVMGATGSGKSSLLRVLRNIWQPDAGDVDSFLPMDPKSVYFLPQKCFLTSGSLIDQVTYPLQISEKVDEFTQEKQRAKALQCIKDVGLVSLLERVDGQETHFEAEWQNVLSPGEMQRLSFARIFYHRPKLAILDEATSALGEEEEDCFYTYCRQLEITMISVGHRDSLIKYHDQMLTLKNGSWEFKSLS